MSNNKKMKQITPLYYNDFGMSFYWKKEKFTFSEKVQLVFKETGFHFSFSELTTFRALIAESAKNISGCNDCVLKNKCHKYLLKTPCTQIDLAVSVQELNAIEDLVEGTLFKINLHEFLHGVGRN